VGAPSGPLNETGPSGPAAPPSPATVPPEPSASTPAAPERLNVVVISVDALRADHMPWQGYEREIAPNLTKLAGESVVYTRAYSLSSYTAMSMGGFLAGRYPGELKRNGYFFSAYPEEVTFFPEILREAGVRTLAGHAHFYFDEKSGFRQGFDDYRMVEGIQVDFNTDNSVTSPEHVALAKEILSAPENSARGPFFAWFHFMDPHDKYRKHDGFRAFGSGGGKDRYDGEIFFTDHHLGDLIEFIDAQPWGARTAIIVTSDHGEAFGEHDMTRHGFEIWEPLVRVPLMVRLPGAAPRRIDTPRSHVDLAPTILDLLAVPPVESFQGQSLVAEMRGEREPEQREVIVDLPRTSHNWRRRALIWGDHKIIAFGDDFRFELYDIVKDPGELQDLRLRDKPLFDEMKKRYLERVKNIHDVCPDVTHMLKGKRPGAPC
jgi:choline-sulfatase